MSDMNNKTVFWAKKDFALSHKFIWIKETLLAVSNVNIKFPQIAFSFHSEIQ